MISSFNHVVKKTDFRELMRLYEVDLDLEQNAKTLKNFDMKFMDKIPLPIFMQWYLSGRPKYSKIKRKIVYLKAKAGQYFNSGFKIFKRVTD